MKKDKKKTHLKLKKITTSCQIKYEPHLAVRINNTSTQTKQEQQQQKQKINQSDSVFSEEKQSLKNKLTKVYSNNRSDEEKKTKKLTVESIGRKKKKKMLLMDQTALETET